jgi:hypothetical protein
MGSGSAEIQDDGAEARRYDGNGAGKAPRLRSGRAQPSPAGRHAAPVREQTSRLFRSAHCQSFRHRMTEMNKERED